MAQPLGLAAVQPPPQQLRGRYQAAAAAAMAAPQLLGAGGFGEVYLYQNVNTRELVAVKRIRLQGLSPGMARDLHHHLPNELRVHYSLNHPLVVDMKDVFMEGNYLFIVLEYLPAGNLFQRVEFQALNEDQARFFFQQLVVTVQYLHAKGVAHRDIKLENTLLKPVLGYPDTPLIQVADFGLSRFGPVAATNAGTGEYKAPEILGLPLVQQQNPETYNATTSDVWAAGVLLYTMLAHQYPFPNIPDNTTDAQRLQLMNQADLHGRIDARNLSEPCRSLLNRMLCFDPQARISVTDVIAHEWFQQNFDPAFLQLQQQLDLQSPCADLVKPQQLEAIITQALAILQPQLLPGAH